MRGTITRPAEGAGGRIRLAAPAKVNLRLRVLAREESGYHSLESLFCAVSLEDAIEIEPSEPGIGLVVEGGVDPGPADENLVVRAARRFYAGVGSDPAVRIRLRKEIPAAAGLGGGSSDAAATLRALNRLHGDAVPAPTLLGWGAELGSDVPFFLCGSPLALGWGRGERLLALPPLPRRPVVIAHPGVAMPTGEAFARIAQLRAGEPGREAFAAPLERLRDWPEVAALAGNDFEAVAAECVPLVGHGLSALRAAEARIALLAGSGASIFGIFDAQPPREAAAAALEDLGFAVWRAETLTAMPEPARDSG